MNTPPQMIEAWGKDKADEVYAKMREQQASRKPRGLGDSIANFTTAHGVPPCWFCKQTQKVLNVVIPYT